MRERERERERERRVGKREGGGEESDRLSLTNTGPSSTTLSRATSPSSLKLTVCEGGGGGRG